jgi:hypothetical protein
MNVVDFDALAPGDCADGRAYLDGALFTGLAVELFPDGSRWTETEFVEGQMQGPSRRWYPSGQLEFEQRHWAGSAHGVLRRWSEQGLLLARETFELGIRVREERWDPAGNQVLSWTIGPADRQFTLLGRFRAAYGALAPAIDAG